LPVTVKHRIGIDDLDSHDHLRRFIDTVAAAGCETFIIHARKAWLQGLSPKQNREIPPLRHDVVQRIKTEYPHLTIVLNGGLKTIADCAALLETVDGCMIGRAAYETPYMLAEADSVLFNAPTPPPTRRQVVERFIPYVQTQLDAGVPLNRMTRHILGLYQGCPGARSWRRHLSENAHLPGAGVSVLHTALDKVEGAMAGAA
ncbi:MAG: tRNA dihydrouridine(20/20a) synthase DusA, partial [Rhodospirillaceae bacterium]